MARHLYTIFIFFFFIVSPAQNDSSAAQKNAFSPGIHAMGGVIAKNYPGVPDDFLAGFVSIDWSFQTKGSDAWHKYYRYPKIGIQTAFGYFNSPALGITVGAVPFMQLRNKKNMFIKLGFGLCYFNKPYDLIHNPGNLYIGRPLTNMTHFSAGRSSRINGRLLMNYGLTFIHSSDGHSALPNVGMNCFLLNLGFEYQNPVSRAMKMPEDQDQKLRWIYTFKSGIGFHEFGATTKAVGGPSYPSYHFSAYASRPFKKIHLVDVGITWAYYTSFHDYIVSQEVYKDKITLRSCTGIVYAGHEFVFGKFGFTTQLGFYIYNPFFIKQKKLEGSWKLTGDKLEAFNTNKIGLVYYPLKKRNTLNKLNHQLVIGAYIKANLAQADLFEYSLGYRF